MTDTEIIETLRTKLAIPGGRHLYAVLGSYPQLAKFSTKLLQAKTADGEKFPNPVSVNSGILAAIPDQEFRALVEDEARRPEPTAKHVAQAFEKFLRNTLLAKGLVVLEHLELVFAYHLELNHLRTLAADDYRILLLLSGKRDRGKVVLFPEAGDATCMLPTNLIADNNLWELGR